MPQPMCRLLIAPVFAALAVCLPVALQGCASVPAADAEPPLSETEQMAAGAAAERRGDLQAALLSYVKAVTANPASAEAHYQVGRLHVALGNVATAGEAFSRALAINPQHVAALEGFGLLLLAQDQPDRARALLEQAVAVDATRWRALNGLGVLADLHGDHAQAQARFEQALKLQPGRADLFNNLGYSNYLAGQLQEARAKFERALALSSDYATAWANLALVRVRMGDYPGGVDAFRETMTPYQACNNVGYLLYMEGKLEPARYYLEQAIALAPSYYGVAQDNLRRLEAAAHAPSPATSIH